jgi:hypothetical protein
MEEYRFKFLPNAGFTVRPRVFNAFPVLRFFISERQNLIISLEWLLFGVHFLFHLSKREV